MQLVSAYNGQLQTLTRERIAKAEHSFTTGLPDIDALAPNQSFARGAIHELLSHSSDAEPKLFAATIALAATQSKIENRKSKITIISDPHGEIYPPALAALGFDLRHVYLLRTQSPQDEIWAITQCLRCKGVGAVIASLKKLSRIEARRLQLAAEVGGTVGILMRHTGRGDNIYAAATRWLVEPAQGESTVQRWKIQLLHGHGGQTSQVVFLEQSRETNSLRATKKLADRPATQTPTTKRAIA